MARNVDKIIKKATEKLSNMDPKQIQGGLKEVRQIFKDVKEIERENEKAKADARSKILKAEKEYREEENRHEEAIIKLEQEKTDREKLWEAFDDFKEQTISDHQNDRESGNEKARENTRQHEIKLLEAMKKK